MKKILTIAALAMVSFSVVAGSPSYNFVRQINMPNTTTERAYRMTAATSDAAGGVYYSSNSNNDNLWYIADPLTADGVDDLQLVVPGSLPGFGNGSWYGMEVDSAGTLFASGSFAGATTPTPQPDQSRLVRVTGSAPTWTPALITLPAPYVNTRIGGCTVVGVDKLVVTVYNTGQLVFLTISGGAATIDGTVAAPGGFTGVAPTCRYDAVNDKLYMSNAFIGTTVTGSNGGLYVYDSDGTAAGTTYDQDDNPFAARDAGQSSTNSAYQGISINTVEGVIVTNQGNNAAGTQGWAFYNDDETGPNETPYLFLNGSETGAPGALVNGDAAMGHTFFTKNGVRYFIGGNEDATTVAPLYGRMMIYAPFPASVSEWSVY